MLTPLALLAWTLACAPSSDKPGSASQASVQVDSGVFVRLRADADALVAQQLARVEAQPQDWLRLEMAASAHLQRARLRAGFEDYAAAEALLQRAFALAPQGAGPWLTRARLNFSLHRLDRVAADLDQYDRTLLLDKPAQAAGLALRGELAFQLGETARAEELLRQSLELHRSAQTLASLAVLCSKTGRVEQAIALYEDSMKMLREDQLMPRAWTLLQLGELALDQGQAQQALTHLDAAAQILPGWWLLESHRASALLALGRPEQALSALQGAAALEPDPETLGHLANLLDTLSQPDEASRTRARALAAYEAQLQQYPEAAAGHAIRFFLDTDPVRALALAQQNASLRPNGEAQVLLARALALNGHEEEARALLAQVLATPWRSGELIDTAADLGLTLPPTPS